MVILNCFRQNWSSMLVRHMDWLSSSAEPGVKSLGLSTAIGACLLTVRLSTSDMPRSGIGAVMIEFVINAVLFIVFLACMGAMAVMFFGAVFLGAHFVGAILAFAAVIIWESCKWIICKLKGKEYKEYGGL